MKCTMYESDILNEFETELFSTDYRDYDSPTQNAKTDYLFEFETFEEWFDYLIDSFVNNTDLTITRNDVETELKKCSKFVENIKLEYEALKELCSPFYDDDEEDEE